MPAPEAGSDPLPGVLVVGEVLCVFPDSVGRHVEAIGE